MSENSGSDYYIRGKILTIFYKTYLENFYENSDVKYVINRINKKL